MKRSAVTTIAMLVLTTALAQAETRASFQLIVGVSPEVSLDAKAIGKILRNVKNKLETVCGPLELVKPQRIELKPDVPTEYNSADTKHHALFLDSGAAVNVVAQISHCKKPAVAGKIAGCAARGGPIIVTPRATRLADAQVWAHEIGHAQGLGPTFKGYENGHNPNKGSLMYSYAGPHWSMSAEECDKYYQAQLFPPNDQGEPIILEDDDAPLPREEMTDQEAFLREEWHEGVDFTPVADDPAGFEAAAKEAITAGDWPGMRTAVLVLGYLNTPDAQEYIFRVLAQREVPNSVAAHYLNDAKANAVVALGYLGAQSSYESLVYGDSLGFLTNVALEGSPTQNVQLLEDGRSLDTLSDGVREMAVTGLAIMAHTSAKAESRFLSALEVPEVAADQALVEGLRMTAGFFGSATFRDAMASLESIEVQ